MSERKIAAASAGDHFIVIDPIEFSRRVRRRIDRDGVSADVVADVNLAVSTGGGSATARQSAPIRQGRSSRTGSAAPDPKEHP